MAKKKLPAIHPGEILLLDFLQPLGVSQYRLAKGITVPPRRINEIVLGKRSITADTALRLARYFGTTERFWLNLQTRYDLEVERDRLGDRLERELDGLVAVGRLRAHRDDGAGPRLDHGDGVDVPGLLVEDLGHAELPAEDPLHAVTA